ncbi:unnamed protein product [Cunninghamella echinulata]
MMLDNKDKDIQLIDLTCETFIVFCNNHDGSTLGIDSELTADYESLIRKFAGFCTFKSNDDALTAQMVNIGHRGIQACVVSPALQASNFKSQLVILMPPIIMTLAKSGQPANELVKSKHIPNIQQSSLNNDLLFEEDISAALAAKTTSLLFKNANGASVRLALNPIFGYMDAKEKWWPPNFAVSTLELVLESLQPQYRYLLVSEILQQYESVKGHDIGSKHASLVSALDTILNANIPLVGISVLEVLNSLFSHLIQTLQGDRAFRDEEPHEHDQQATFEYAVHQGLAHSIAGLATQTYYQNQLDDITGYILSKLRVGTTLEHIEGLSLAQYRRVALKCLDLISTASRDNGPSTHDDSINEGSENGMTTNDLQGDNDSDQVVSSSMNATISLETWVPAIGLLIDPQPETRVEFAYTLVRYLEATTDEDLKTNTFPKHTLNQHGDVMFINCLQQTIIQWASLDEFNVQDVLALNALLSSLTKRFAADGTIKAIPLIFQIQHLVKQGDITHTARQRALAAVTVEYLDGVGKYYHVDRLIHYVDQVRSERLKNKEYSPLFVPSLADNYKDNVWSFEQVEPENSRPVDAFLDRHVVVEILSKDAPLRDEEDTHGLDLESKLYVEWGSEAFVNQERSFRIRTSRNLEDLKPKLATPWMSTDFTKSQDGKKQTIKVENLKEALISNTSNNEDNETTVDGLHILTSSSLAKRTKDIRTDMTSLLSGLNVNGTNSQTTTSLVNPPYVN